jgi:glucosamine--fructose-6-phosphate aminotransferase (isomerizing)
MCGIFGYIGKGDVAEVLAEGIRRLEYRGYDSWGMAVADGGDLTLERQAGRLTALDPAFRQAARSCWGGIAHTRWATHGEPTARNAHPHLDCKRRIAVVHNGIIENYEALRARLREEGHVFHSDTDSEVIAHLVEKFYDGKNLRIAFLDAIRLLRGAYAVAIVCSDEPEAIYVARDSSPLVVGHVKGSAVVASDPTAVVPFTRRVVYLGDQEIGVVRPSGLETWNLRDEPVEREAQQIALDLEAVERGGYAHFMLKEIFEQPRTLADAMRGRLVRGEGTARFGGLGLTDKDLRRVNSIRILACGTSWHAGLVGRYLFEELARIPTVVDYAAEYRYSAHAVERGALALAISQSGETADTLAAVREAKRLGATVLGICNVVGSSIARECGRGVYLHAGPEIGVASTKAFTSQLVVLTLLALYMGRLRGMSLADGLRFLDALEALPEQAEAVLRLAPEIQEMARLVTKRQNVLYVGRLYEYPLALEGALKLKEISYIHAEGIPAAELKHGPIALVDPDMPVVVLAAQSGILDKMKSNAQEIRSRKGRLFLVCREGSKEMQDLAERVIPIPATPDPLTPILGAIPLQLLAYYAAVERGCDVDRPRNLAKSVTVE